MEAMRIANESFSLKDRTFTTSWQNTSRNMSTQVILVTTLAR